MTTTKKRLPGTVLVQQESIEQATSLLEQLPEKPKEVWSLREAIDLLQDSISTALDRGYSHEEIAALLADKNIKISVSSLKRYLASTKKDKSGTAGKTRRRRSTAVQKKAVTEAAAALPEVEPAASGEPAATPKKRGPRTSSTRSSTAAKTKSPRTSTKTKTTSTTSTRGRKKQA
ncbi:hypothetical protein P7L53_00020 [Thermoleptolyngbya sichuanensis XZ-Cy5]|uniref:hypothetical protein n=1 Tax=Thermoleptolyngbya sichuanensis TaxID=2885951 RepID=UPI00240D9A1E|nr:hypothetical protein [Thermoleptolyngbya sichuanensis]MDG2614616.1 hypothetical protein [Thermoleptolyngbya sichuanensis XZ-Cy5]